MSLMKPAPDLRLCVNAVFNISTCPHCTHPTGAGLPGFFMFLASAHGNCSHEFHACLAGAGCNRLGPLAGHVHCRICMFSWLRVAHVGLVQCQGAQVHIYNAKPNSLGMRLTAQQLSAHQVAISYRVLCLLQLGSSSIWGLQSTSMGPVKRPLSQMPPTHFEFVI